VQAPARTPEDLVAGLFVLSPRAGIGSDVIELERQAPRRALRLRELPGLPRRRLLAHLCLALLDRPVGLLDARHGRHETEHELALSSARVAVNGDAVGS
jgi:hypothetical protein